MLAMGIHVCIPIMKHILRPPRPGRTCGSTFVHKLMLNRFERAGPAVVLRMWRKQANEVGTPLTAFHHRARTCHVGSGTRACGFRHLSAAPLSALPTTSPVRSLLERAAPSATAISRPVSLLARKCRQCSSQHFEVTAVDHPNDSTPFIAVMGPSNASAAMEVHRHIQALCSSRRQNKSDQSLEVQRGRSCTQLTKRAARQDARPSTPKRSLS